MKSVQEIAKYTVLYLNFVFLSDKQQQFDLKSPNDMTAVVDISLFSIVEVDSIWLTWKTGTDPCFSQSSTVSPLMCGWI